MFMLHILIFLIPIFLLARGDFKPKLDYTLQDRYLLHKKSPFSEFNEVEKATLWGKEYYIGTHFAKSLDLYQAITSFKRANILIPEEFLERKRQIEYQILFAYYLGKKYQDAVDVFESSLLSGVDGSFSAYHDLLVILFESYTKVEERDKAKVVLRLLDKSYPMTAKKHAQDCQRIPTASQESSPCTAAQCRYPGNGLPLPRPEANGRHRTGCQFPFHRFDGLFFRKAELSCRNYCHLV